MFQTSTPVDLNSFQIKLTTPKVYTSQGVPVVADAIASVKIADSLDGIANYAEQFLGKKQGEIEEEVSKVLGTNLRAILSKLTVEKINNDRESFNDAVQKIAQKELNNMGFKITAFGLDDLRDADPENGYLENLGRPRIAEVRKEADKAESDAQKETRIYKAQNDQEAQEEENRRQTSIAESKKEKDLKDAAIKEETERARAKSEKAYELENARLAKEVTEERLNVEYIERQKQVQLEQEEQKRRKAKADADAYDIKVKAEAEADKARIDGQTQADIIREKGKAEAESKRLMAEAMEKYGEAAIMEMLLKVLPDYAREVAKPLSNIKELKILDMGGTDGKGGVNKVSRNVTETMLGLQEGLKETTGLDLKGMLESYMVRGRAPVVYNTTTAPEKTEEKKKKEKTETKEDSEDNNNQE